MAKTGNQTYSYAKPEPFVGPAIESVPDAKLGLFGPFLIKPHDQLYYSGPVIEDIMFKISLEFEFRGKGQQTWRAYNSSPTDFDLFIAGGSREGTNLSLAKTLHKHPLKWFPLYIKDIQDKILELVADPRWPDTIGSAMARIFLNHTTAFGSKWSSTNRLPNNLVVPAPATDDNQGEGTVNLTPFNSAVVGFPFLASGDHIKKVVPRMGVDFKSEAYVNRGPLAVTTSDEPEKSNFQGNSKNRWPRSVVGKRREQTGITIKDGSVIDKPGRTVEGIDSIHMEAAPADTDIGRPEQFRQVAQEDAVLPAAGGQPDFESGYSWFGHHPMVLEQLRFQPPHVEDFDGGVSQIRDYTEAVFSNTTTNIPWHLSQPREKVHFSDWGGWLMQGLVGMTGSAMFMEAYADEQHDNLFTQCPFSVFFPPKKVTCSCGGSNTAYGIWSSSTESLIWNTIPINNPLVNTGAAKLFGPKTRLRINAAVSLGAGTGSKGGAYFQVGIRTSRISSVNLQSFITVMGIDQSFDKTLNIPPGNDGSVDINIMDAIQHHYPTYDKLGTDSLLAIIIAVNTTSGETGVFDTIDGPTGPFPPSVNLGCAVGTSTATVSKVYLFEPEIVIGDNRTPAGFDPGRKVQDPPDYNLPILS